MKLKNFLAVFSAVVLASLVSVSCQPKDDGPEEPTLSLSTQALTLNNQAQNPTEAQVQVTTNQPKWNVSTNATWLTATRKGEGIVVGAEANMLGKDRKAEVVVYAGGLVEKIAVTQSASKIFINVSSETVEAPDHGGQFFIAVETNGETWAMETEEVDWLKATKAGEFVKADVAPNKTDAAREAKIYIRVGAETKAVKVVQAANQVSTVYFPVIDTEMSIYQRAKMEAARGSIVIRLSEPSQGFFGPQPGMLTVIPEAEGFINASYVIPLNNPMTWELIVMVADTWERVAEGAFIETLKKEGFAYMEDMSAEKKLVYQNSEKRLRASILEEAQEDGSIVYGVIFERYYIQDKDYPTFSKFPYFLKDLLDKPDKKVKDIVAFMEGRGYKKDQDGKNRSVPEELYYQTFVKQGEVGKEEPKDVVTYYHKTGDQGLDPALLQSLTQFAQIFTQDKINYAMWLRPDGAYVPTKEFIALKDKEGFTANEKERDGTFLYVTADDFVLLLRTVRFSDVNPGEPSLQLALWYEAGASKAKVSRLGNYYLGVDKAQVKAKLGAKMATVSKTQANNIQNRFSFKDL
ncbi:Bacteroidetes-Associated Carbohydrate-binding Often N-terminal [Porphyromonas cangingivalis]|uniref:BACON domain-containing protein n=1 Tax=Porphyromonas cangingivalis TaxID=36874 RepID=UPI000D9CAD56|nr:BACON domain-containing protein [Porphyromonas cangingivalis]SPY35715.1 Bacteroidetes-Associated Carbohydrate-binding Often N-terminal [Porphyromonas cangingivalis]